MAMRFALASGVVLVFTATATALPTRTKKHRALDALVGGSFDPDEAPGLKLIIVGGEACPQSVVDAWAGGAYACPPSPAM